MFIDAYKKALDVLMKKPLVLWGLSLLSGLIVILGTVLTIPVFALGFVVSYLVTCGMAKVYLDGLKGQEVNSDQMFACFNKNFLRIAGGMAWRDLWVLIWALIPVAGPFLAVYKGYCYQFVPYILITKPEVTATQALRLSMEMTNGKKLQMFLADLCIFGGIFVVAFVLALMANIPYLGVLFAFVLFLVYIVVYAIAPVFTGLYRASFYEE